MAQAEPSEGVLAPTLRSSILPFQARGYRSRVLASTGTAALFTAVFHGIGFSGVGILPHLALTTAMSLALAVGRPAQGAGAWLQRTLLAVLAAALLTVALDGNPGFACLGAGSLLGLGLAPGDGDLRARGLDAIVMGLAALAASLVYGTLQGSGLLGPLAPLVERGVCGGLWGLVLAAGAAHRHFVPIGTPALDRLERLADRLPEPHASVARRLLVLARAGLAAWTPDQAGSIGRYHEGLAPLTAALAQAAEDLQALAENPVDVDGVAKRLLVARQALEQAPEDESRRVRAALVSKLETRQDRALQASQADERRRGRLDLIEVCLEEAAAGRDPVEALAVLD